jgi:hypothetical protein
MELNKIVIGAGGNTIKELLPDNVIQRMSESNSITWINTLADAPTPISDVITFDGDGSVYMIADSIDWGINRIEVNGNGVTLAGTNPNKSLMLSSTTGAFISCASTTFIVNISIIGTGVGAYGVYAEDSSTDTITLDTCAIIGFGVNVYIKDYKAFVTKNVVGITDCTNGIVLDGVVESCTIKTVLFERVTGYAIDLSLASLSAVDIDRNVCFSLASTTFLKTAIDDGNFSGNGFGTIRANKILGDLAGTGSEGYSPLNLKWESIGNNIINDSDRISPNGWGYYVDDAVSNIVAGSGEISAVKLTVNGLGVTSDSDYLPKVIRGDSELWDTSANDLMPITLGDSYNMRVAFVITSTSGNPARINVILDIGATGAITIPVASYTSTLKTGTPQSHTFTIPYFTGSTFLANGGQIFVYCDSGTATIGNRSLMIQRSSSGAS